MDRKLLKPSYKTLVNGSHQNCKGKGLGKAGVHWDMGVFVAVSLIPCPWLTHDGKAYSALVTVCDCDHRMTLTENGSMGV